MPYIEQQRRVDIDNDCDPANCGELNYAVTMFMLKATPERWNVGVNAIVALYVANKGLRYQTINDVMGALTGAAYEFTRRDRGMEITYHRADLLHHIASEFYFTTAAPYEDRKILANGDLPYASAS